MSLARGSPWAVRVSGVTVGDYRLRDLVWYGLRGGLAYLGAVACYTLLVWAIWESVERYLLGG